MSALDLVSAALLTVWIGLAVCLAVIDARMHRLPNRLVLPLYPVGAAAALAAAFRANSPAPLVGAAASAAVLFAGYWLLHRFGGGMGGGDVKLAGAIGLLTGTHGWEAPLAATAVAFFVGGLTAVVLVASRRAHRRSRIPFGPFMLLGAAVAMISPLA